MNKHEQFLASIHAVNSASLTGVGPTKSDIKAYKNFGNFFKKTIHPYASGRWMFSEIDPVPGSGRHFSYKNKFYSYEYQGANCDFYIDL